MKNARAFVALLALGGWLAQPASAADGNPGRAAYFKYCSSCHGDDGRGGGVVARALQPKPPDLTQLAAQHGGTFPYDAVKTAIDGRQRVAAHGSSKMPVWGKVFAAEQTPMQPEAHARSQVQLIVNYLASIQTK